MWRVVVEILLPLVLPTALYLLWLSAERRRREKLGSGETLAWADAPWIWLGAIGLLLATLVAVALALIGGEPTAGQYVPPHVIDGKIVPGHVETPK